MKRIFILSFASVVFSTNVLAQNAPTGVALLKFGVVSPNLPRQFSERWKKVGFNAGVGMDFRLTSRFFLRGEVDFDAFALDREKYLKSLRLIEEWTINNGNAIFLTAAINVKMNLLKAGGRLSPYLFAGGGISHFVFDDVNLKTGGRGATIEGESLIPYIANAGCGLLLKLNNELGLLLDAKYTLAFTSFEKMRVFAGFGAKENTQYLTLTVGICFFDY